MKRKTSPKGSVCLVRLTWSYVFREETISRLSCFLGKTSAVACACSLIVLCSLLSLSGVYYFCFLFSYLVKFLGTLTRVVKLNHTTLGLLQTTTRYRAVPQSYWYVRGLLVVS